MNLVQSAPVWVLAILALLLVAAAVEDAVRLRISNYLSLGVLGLAVLAMVLAGFPSSLWQNGVVFVAFLAIGTLMFSTGQMGGGDIKLLAALGAWVNLIGTLALLSSVFLAGGLLALIYIAARRMKGRRAAKSSTSGIPYGVAIVVGAFFAFALQRGMI